MMQAAQKLNWVNNYLKIKGDPSKSRVWINEIPESIEVISSSKKALSN